VPESAYGVAEWFEAGLYLPVYSLTGEGHSLFDSARLLADHAMILRRGIKWK